jgi:hypothetical protein
MLRAIVHISTPHARRWTVKQAIFRAFHVHLLLSVGVAPCCETSVAIENCSLSILQFLLVYLAARHHAARPYSKLLVARTRKTTYASQGTTIIAVITDLVGLTIWTCARATIQSNSGSIVGDCIG